MGTRGSDRRQPTGFQNAQVYFELGCQLLGKPRGGPFRMGTTTERADRIKAGRAEFQRRVAAAEVEEERRIEHEKAEKQKKSEENFGNGEEYGDGNWSSPMHGTTADGREVTISVGRGKRAGQNLVCLGHVSRAEFYDDHEDGFKGHDHYFVDGRLAADRARYDN